MNEDNVHFLSDKANDAPNEIMDALGAPAQTHPCWGVQTQQQAALVVISVSLQGFLTHTKPPTPPGPP